jgi:hypothetical protein
LIPIAPHQNFRVRNLLVVKTGKPTQLSSPLALAIIREEDNISETSKSAKRNCLQKSSDGWTTLGTNSIPSALTWPSRTGQVRGFDAIPMLSRSFKKEYLS